jgi:hypothetical protein
LPFCFITEGFGKHICSLLICVAISDNAHFAGKYIAGPPNVDLVCSPKMSHRGISASLEYLYGRLIIFMKVHFDVNLLNSLIVFICYDIRYCPTDDVAPKSLLVFTGHGSIKHHMGYSFP